MIKNKKAKLQLINREESWLHFNERVLQEAADPEVPLLERLKFLGIFSNNLDEFFRVRVATLKRMIEWDDKELRYITYSPKKVLKRIIDLDQLYNQRFNTIFTDLTRELKSEKIHLLNEKELSPDQGDFVKRFFQDHVRPHLFPIMLNDSDMEFPLKDKSIYLSIALSKKGILLKDKFALIKVPTQQISRFLVLPDEGEHKFIILLDDVIRYNLDEIFSIFNYDSIRAYTIKFTRDAELDLDNDISKSFLEIIAESLKKRTTGIPVRFIYDREMPEVLLKFVMRKINISRKDIPVPGGRYHNFKDFMNFPDLKRPDLKYPSKPPLAHKNLIGRKSLFDAIRERDIMLHFPYQRFHYLIDLLREASIDPKVRSIRMSLYRLAEESNIVNALINAARNGKSVTVFMELQARFDEEANIHYAEKMQSEGIRIIHGIPGFKVHAKLILIRRKEGNTNRYFAGLSTGNFNEMTAKVYADDCLLSARPEITSEVLKVFELFDANFKQQRFKSLIVSPFRMRDHFIRHLRTEMQNAKAGKEAWAIIKLNNLVDERIVKQIIQAAQAGVNIKLIVRTSFVPVIEDLVKTCKIEAISIVDHYLEHSRVLIFCNGGDEKYYISSADWMVRNFDNRIEVAVPILDPEIRKELKDMLMIQLKDNIKARLIGMKQYNIYRQPKDSVEVRSQNEIYSYFKKQLETQIWK